MRIYNKATRSFIINREYAIDGCRFPLDELGNDKAYIAPDSEVEVEDEVGVSLIKNYPKELIEIKDRVTKKKKG